MVSPRLSQRRKHMGSLRAIISTYVRIARSKRSSSVTNASRWNRGFSRDVLFGDQEDR